MANPFGLKKLARAESELLRKMAEERFDFFNAVFLDTVLQPFHKKWFEFQFTNQRTLVLGPRASWKCVSSDSLIPTAEGLSYLHEISPASEIPYTAEVQSTIGSCLGVTNAHQVFCNGVESGLEFETDDGFTLSCGRDHGIFIWDGSSLKFRPAGALKVGDQLLSNVAGRIFHKPTIILSMSQEAFGSNSSLSFGPWDRLAGESYGDNELSVRKWQLHYGSFLGIKIGVAYHLKLKNF